MEARASRETALAVTATIPYRPYRPYRSYRVEQAPQFTCELLEPDDAVALEASHCFIS